MELPILSANSSIGQYVQQCKEIIGDFFAPLDEEAFNYFYLNNQRFTMPLQQIQTLLNKHYVSLKPLHIFYSLDNNTTYKECFVQVISPLTYDEGVKLMDLNSKQVFHLPAKSILKAEHK